ncbi:hypothetical protein Pmar_PMAR001412 [Perkinsus marinus ATCC 50983]|uniref:Uncharacterized protein n=1 Tax=Perkinsus marinus (strain ATCC 50983 / TXsc) TaxID=423536 RepID=C5KJM5_PERM5|nr:hypothetical protein Pmar_PMAR001412 [Perkinsus marinus ATCC 50983]EER15359.1 hypothetical protein Pmar_PMAR001412 [Perkinsus marinus ATCC 50983]|eukprot:XP_002783563.1 hypothetical protein Pmar_PMAR001412 [Perkinsus marinus ATCC 50983]
MRTMLLLVLMCGFASLVGGSVRHVSAPQGCTGVRKPSSSQFCAVGTIDTDASKVNITIYIFDIDDPSKSVYFHIQLAANGSEPAGLNITGGGIAKVNIVQVVKGMLFVPIRLSAETVAGGRGHYDPSTGRWTADITVIADADFMVSGESDLYMRMGNIVKTNMSEDHDFRLLTQLEGRTGDKFRGMDVGLELKLRTLESDLYTWEIFCKDKYHVWLFPIADITNWHYYIWNTFNLSK